MMIRIVTEPAAEPVSSAEAKEQLRELSTDHDTEIASLIKQARQQFERDTSRALITQTWKMFVDTWPAEGRAFNLPLAPLASVTTIQYRDAAGALQTWATTEYVVDADSEPGRIVLATSKSFPALETDRPNAVIVTFVCGYGAAASNVPEMMRRAVLLLVEHYYDRGINETVYEAYQRISRANRIWRFV